MKASNGLPDYLEALPPAMRARFSRLRDIVQMDTAVAPKAMQTFIFLPNQADHSAWDDAATVFWRAVTEIHLAERRFDGEVPVLYWGFHSIDLFLRRTSNGVVLTDRTLYIRDVAGTRTAIPLGDLVGMPDPVVTATENVLSIGGTTLDLAPAKRLFPERGALDAAVLLSSILHNVVAFQSADPDGPLDSTPTAQPGRETVAARITASTMSGDFLLPGRPADAKKLAKLSAKWKFGHGESLQFALVSGTLAGSYGIAVTDAAVYSRDLMEPLDRTDRTKIDPGGISWNAYTKTFRLTDTHSLPTFPLVTDTNRDYFIALLGDLLRLEC
ncbi:MAG: hypothetical protein JWQ43_3601 [Glaciihabitans sp.]|nr:hypothetical protein [Glaciihabitans sp.]